jgi:hypothetical protein
MSVDVPRRKRRLTILTLMAIVGLSALGLAALRNPTMRVVALSNGLTTLLVLTATVAALTDRRRLFCLGFATFAGGVLILGDARVSTVDSPGLALNLGFILFGFGWEDWVAAHSDSFEIVNDLVTLAVGLVGGLAALALRPRDQGMPDAGRGAP